MAAENHSKNSDVPNEHQLIWARFGAYAIIGMGVALFLKVLILQRLSFFSALLGIGLAIHWRKTCLRADKKYKDLVQIGFALCICAILSQLAMVLLILAE